DGLPGGCSWTAASGAFAWNWSPSPAAPGASCRGRDDYNRTGHPDCDSRYRESRVGHGRGHGIVRRFSQVLIRLYVICARSVRFLVLGLLTAVCLATAARAQQQSFTWEEIRDQFLARNPTLQA